MSQALKKVEKLERDAQLVMPAMLLPGFRTSIAVQDGVQSKILIKTWGGIGDQICAEPTLRWALNHFKDCEISLASEKPELFQHLPFHRVFNLKHEKPEVEKFFVFDTITDPSNIVWQFMSHCLVNAVDFPALCAFRCQLPIAEKEITLSPPEAAISVAEGYADQLQHGVVIHPGKHWPSKTFPKDFWDKVITSIISQGCLPILIGADADDNRGTVNVATDGCLDLRNKLSIMESVALLQKARVVLTNDSSPLHMAASGDAWIGLIATCKHPDYIMHWRHGQWAWQMVNHGKGGIWEHQDYCPNKEQEITVEHVDEALLRTWLPDPEEYARWATSKLSF